MHDAEAMARAMTLAWRGWGRVGANPLVGAVVLCDGVVVGEGFHAEFGGPHAEVSALRAAGEAGRGAELVVTLEPCAHHGKTPPCTKAILAAGIRRVVFGAADEHPRAKGGAAVLRQSGVEVVGGVLEAEVRAQNALFYHRLARRDRPFVALKLAVSLDAKIADREGRSRWVSGPQARDYVQWLRAGFDAIAVGVGTARADDPSLTVRGAIRPKAAPLRVVLDRRAELPRTSALLRPSGKVREGATLVVVGSEAPAERVAALREAGALALAADEEAEILAALSRRAVRSVLVEGGGVVAGRLLGGGFVDRMYLIVAPILLGPRGVPAFPGVPDAALDLAKRWRTVERLVLGDDSLLVLDRP